MEIAGRCGRRGGPRRWTSGDFVVCRSVGGKRESPYYMYGIKAFTRRCVLACLNFPQPQVIVGTRANGRCPRDVFIRIPSFWETCVDVVHAVWCVENRIRTEDRLVALFRKEGRRCIHIGVGLWRCSFQDNEGHVERPGQAETATGTDSHAFFVCIGFLHAECFAVWRVLADGRRNRLFRRCAERLVRDFTLHADEYVFSKDFQGMAGALPDHVVRAVSGRPAFCPRAEYLGEEFQSERG